MKYLDINFAKRARRLPRFTLSQFTASSSRVIAGIFVLAIAFVCTYTWVVLRIQQHERDLLNMQANLLTQKDTENKTAETQVSTEIAALNTAYAARQINGTVARRMTALFQRMNPTIGLQSMTIALANGEASLSFGGDSKDPGAGDQLYAILNHVADYNDVESQGGVHSFTIGAQPRTQ